MAPPNDDDLEILIEKLKLELSEKINQHYKAVMEFSQNYNPWKRKTESVIASTNKIISDLEEHHRNVNIASVTGSSVSLAGGIACAAGLILAPFTLGASTVLTVGGIVAGSAGTVTSVGARFTEIGIKGTAFRELILLLNDHGKETVSISSCIDCCKFREQALNKFLQNNDYIKKILDHPAFVQLCNNDEMKETVTRIKDGSATPHDYFVLIELISRENLHPLKKLSENKQDLFHYDIKRKVLNLPGKPGTLSKRDLITTVKLIYNLRKSLWNVKTCALLLESWRIERSAAQTAGTTGKTVIQAASRGIRVVKTVAIGISAAFDLEDIISSSIELNNGTTDEDIQAIKRAVTELKSHQTKMEELYRYFSGIYLTQ